MNNTELALKLFSPNKNGISRWVKKSDLVGEFSPLFTTNGNHWYRNKGLNKYIFEKSKDSDGETMWRFNGFNDTKVNRYILPKIKKELSTKKCAHTGFNSIKSNQIEIDHKNGRYNGIEVSDITKQVIDDFQPLNRQSNLQKRSSCNLCKKTNKRFDAKCLGYSVSYIFGDENYDKKIKCVGCYWHDCIKFKEEVSKKWS